MADGESVNLKFMMSFHERASYLHSSLRLEEAVSEVDDLQSLHGVQVLGHGHGSLHCERTAVA